MKRKNYRIKALLNAGTPYQSEKCWYYESKERMVSEWNAAHPKARENTTLERRKVSRKTGKVEWVKL